MGRIAFVVLAVGVASSNGPSRGQDPAPIAESPSETDGSTASPEAKAEPAPYEAAEAEALRALAVERLKSLGEPAGAGKAADPRAEARAKALREILKARLEILALFDKNSKALHASENPETTPEAEAAGFKVATDRDKSALVRASKDPASLLPDVFRAPEARAAEAALAEMKDAIESAQVAADELKKGLDAASIPSSRKSTTPLVVARARREEIRLAISALGPRTAEQEAALGSAATAEERELAKERLINLHWEARAEALLLKETEARIALEARRASFSEVRVESQKAELELARKRLDLMQKTYRQRVDRQLSDLKKASASEGLLAEKSSDPLERYRARRAKEQLDEEALLHEEEGELAATPAVSLSDQRERADKMAEDFERLKKLVTGGRSSGLVAQRLNNSYRRVDSERAAIVRNELAQISLQLGRYENLLTEVELDQLNDSRGDRSLKENLLNELPGSRKSRAVAVFEETERKQGEILERRRRVLADLADRADRTRQQVFRRLKILDDQHGFVRTHLFWVRDSPPLGPATVEQGRREASELAATLLVIASEPWTWSHWQRVSPDFLWAGLGLVTLPWILYRVRKALRGLLDRERPGPSLGDGNPT